MRKTRWFSGKVKPVRKGWYECKHPKEKVRWADMDYWDGKYWRMAPHCVPYDKKYQTTYQWRGLTARAK